MVDGKLYDLLKIGLTSGEARVYLALSELGSSTVGPIVKKARVAYSNIYDILDRLIGKGLVSFIVKNKTKHFQAASPSNLMLYLDKKEKEILEQKESFMKAISKLENLQEGKAGESAEVFVGKKGLRTAYEKLVKGSTKSDELLFFYIHDEEYGEESNLFYNSIVDLSTRARNRGICNEDYKKSWFAKKSKFLKMSFTNMPLPGNIDILHDKVLIVTWRGGVFSVLIHSEDLASSFRNYFERVWEEAGK